MFARRREVAVSRYSPFSSIELLLDRVLHEASAPTGTRRWLLRRAAVGAAAGVAAASAGVFASSAFADDRPHGSNNGDGSIDDWGVFASTTEALTVTILTELLRRTSLHPEVPSEVSLTFDAVYAAELDHWNFISQHFNPSTKRFWIPDGFFGGADDALDLTAVGKGVSGGETLFVNTYLVGVTTFAKAGNSNWARYAAEAAGDESEHRVLGQTLAGESPPNNLGFEEFVFDNVGDIGAAAESAGFGFGQQGTAAGRFYDLPDPPMAPPIPISSNEPK
jgi:hypothetical protein